MKAHQFRHEMQTTSNVFGRSHGIQVVFEGDQAKTDGKTIYLPALPDSADLTQEQVRIMRGFVDHEAGHLRHSDMPYLLDKYEKWSNNNKEGLVTLHNSIEDVWLEDRVIRDYPGARKNLATLNDTVSKKELKGFEEVPEAKEYFQQVNADSISLAIRCHGRDYLGSENNRQLLEMLPENIQEWGKKIASEIEECTSTQDNERLAKAVYKLLEQDPELQSNPEDFDQSIGDGVGDGDDGEAKESQKTQQEFEKGKPVDGEGQGQGDPMSDAVEEEGVPGGVGKPKGDYKGAYRIFSTKYDKVYTKKDKRMQGGEAKYERIKGNIGPSVSVMKGKLRRTLLSLQKRDYDFGKERGRLDTKRLVQGYQSNPFVYKTRKDRSELDTVVTLLVDHSGSMCGSRINVATECAIAMAEAVDGTGIPFQVVGFDASFNGAGDLYERTHGSKGPWHRIEKNNMYLYKNFDEKLYSSRGALGTMHNRALSNNADRDAIVWCVNELVQRQESRKVLIVFSDGEPANYTRGVGYDELERHARLAVQDASKVGVECIGIGIQSDAVKDIYDDAIVVRSLQDFSGRSFKKFSDTLLRGLKQ